MKSYGYGICSFELVLPSAEKISSNKIEETEIYKHMQSLGIDFKEIILDHKNQNRAFALLYEGNEPTKYEMANISDEDWESIRTAVDLFGSQVFSDRLTMLEGARK
jgi:hypothetical protein